MDVTPVELDSLKEQVRSLRTVVSALQTALAARHRVTLRALQPRPLLGQPVVIAVTVTDWQGKRARSGLPVTLTTSWGRLRPSGATLTPAGPSLAAQTGLDGTLRVTLLPPADEELLEPQQAALETMLRAIDPAAPTPQDAQPGLVEMARQYRWEVNADFRKAVDIYVDALGRRLLETITTQDHMVRWSYLPATVLAFVPEQQPEAAGAEDAAATGGPVQAAALTVAFKNWLGPWLQTYRSVARQENPLGQNLEQVTSRGGEPSLLLGRLFDRVQTYVTGERGRVGQYLGRQIAQDSLRELLDKGLEQLPVVTRVALFPTLQATGQAVAQAGLDAASVAHQAEATLRRQVTGQLDTVEARLATTVDNTALAAALEGKVDAAALNSALADKVDTNTLAAALANKVDMAALGEALAGKVDVAAFDSALASKVDPNALNAALAAKVDAATLTAALAGKVDISAFDQALAGKVDTDTLNTALAGKVDTAALTSALANKVDAAVFTKALAGKVDTAEFTKALDEKVDATSFDRFRGEIDEALKSRVDVGTFNSTISTLAAKAEVAALQQSLAAKVDQGLFDQALAQKADAAQVLQLQTDFGNQLMTKADAGQLTQLQADLAGQINAKVDVSSFTKLSGDLATRLTKIDTSVNALTRRVFPP
jgi:hypothetical protein